MRESIFSSMLRAFFVTLFGTIGLCIGLVILILLVSLASDSSTNEPTQSLSHRMLPNAEGVRKVVGKDAPVVLQINIHGVIGGDTLNMGSVRKILLESREGSLKDDRVKAVLLNINSPGGTVVDADGIYRALKTYKEQYKVPVYAFVDGICASGAMYAAAAADKIFANEISLIGSIGVISPAFFNFTQLIDKVGIQALTLSAGKDKDILNPLRPWKPGEQDQIQELIDYYYQLFVNIMTSNRPRLDKEKLVKDYGARIFNAEQAKEFGYVDEIGYTQRHALKDLLAAANITTEEYEVIELHRESWLSDLFNSQSPLLTGTVMHRLDVGAELDPKLANQFLYLYRP